MGQRNQDETDNASVEDIGQDKSSEHSQAKSPTDVASRIEKDEQLERHTSNSSSATGHSPPSEPTHIPGAFSIRGLYIPGASSIRGLDGGDADSITAEDTVRDSSVGVETPADMRQNESGLHSLELDRPIEAYRVDPEPTMEQRAESRLMVTATATAAASEDKHKGKILFLVALVAVIALAIALPTLTIQTWKGGESVDQVSGLGQLLVSFLFSADDDGSIIEGRQYRKTEAGREVLTTRGNTVMLDCEVAPCKDNPGSCLIDRVPYEEGCCFGTGPDCSEENRCGELCPVEACTRQYGAPCSSQACFDCPRLPNGDELFRMRYLYGNIFCSKYGTSLTTAGEPYDWVIYCAEILRDYAPASNLGEGEYFCNALRVGNGIVSALGGGLPCQYIQLGECGCAPEDISPFDLPPPETDCRTPQDCPYLCSNWLTAGVDRQSLCDAFDIEWWQGDNFMNFDLFLDPREIIVQRDYELKINIVVPHGEESVSGAAGYFALVRSFIPLLLFLCI